MGRVDQNALRRAMQMAKAESPGRREQLEAKLAEEPWLEVAMFAAYVCQTRTLRLKPWECPPCDAGPTADGRDYENAPKAIAMKQRLIDAGLSVFEPDPPTALAAVEARAPGELPPAAA